MLYFQKMIPVNNEDLVLSSKCENSDSSLNKEHLLFSFIPSKYHIPFFTNRLFILINARLIVWRI